MKTMRSKLRLAGCLALLAASMPLMSAPAAALEYEELNEVERNFVRNYTVGNALWTLLHETGHMIVDQFDLPVLGREEDAVDAFATVVLIAAGNRRADQALEYVARQWLSERSSADPPSDSSLADEHSLPGQRGFATLCYMMGSDESKLQRLARTHAYPIERLDNCTSAYPSAVKGWSRLILPHIREAGASRFKISYAASFGEEDERYARVRGWLQEERLLESVGAMAGNLLEISSEIQIAAGFCSEERNPDEKDAQNAYWSGYDSQMLLCYELSVYHEAEARKIVEMDRQRPTEQTFGPQ